MVVSNYAKGTYRCGWACNICGQTGRGYRWLCLECESDYCFTCRPNTTNLLISTQFLCDSGEHEMIVSDFAGGYYANGWKCNICKHNGLGKRWFCQSCETDYCFDCRRAP